MKKKRANYQTVLEFMRAVYPEATELAMASFDEETVLREATRLLTELRQMGSSQGAMIHKLGNTPIITGEAADRIKEEIRHGTPDTPKRIDTIKRADELIQKVFVQKEKL